MENLTPLKRIEKVQPTLKEMKRNFLKEMAKANDGSEDNELVEQLKAFKRSKSVANENLEIRN